MKKKKEGIVIGALALLLVALICVVVYVVTSYKTNEKDTSTFAVHTEVEVFQNVPIMTGKSIEFTEVKDVGADNYMLNVENTTLSEYREYLSVLEKNGFTKHVDNGEEGIEGNVFATYYQKDKLMVHICHFVNLQQTMITAFENTEMSKHLFYDESYIADNVEGARTTLHFPELYNVGNSFVFQLKNGHFIISDGGQGSEMPYLLDYLESLVPAGEKPVVEAWFISHSHPDHMGVIDKLISDTQQLNRLYVENIYFNEPSKAALKTPAGLYDNPGTLITICKAAAEYLRSTDGNGPEYHRTRMGDRYYFNDLTIDIIYSQELIEPAEWKTWNSSSTMMMCIVEGQKIMISADADIDCQTLCMKIFDSTYFDLTIYQVPHHGKNVTSLFTKYCSSIDTLLYPTIILGSSVSSDGSMFARTLQNEFLKEKAQEALTYADGTKILTFPYENGTVKSLPEQEWIYNATPPSWKTQEQ